MEDRQIIDAGATTGETSTQIEIGSATEITGSETVHETDITMQPVTETTGQTGDTTTSIETGNGGVLVGGETSPMDQIGTGETNIGGSQTTPEESSSNPIVGVDANVNPESGTVEADLQTDTSGELEDRQIINASATTGETSTPTETGSATEITGSETVHEIDVTTQPVTDTTGQTGDTTTSVETEGNGGILVGGETSPTGEAETGTSTEEPSDDSSNPIVGVDAEVNPESGTVEADATVDTSGELEERQILDADGTAGDTTSTGAEVESATDITDSTIVEETDITTQPITETTGQTGDTTTSVETQEGNGGVLIGGETSPTAQVETKEITTGTESSGASTEEPSSDSSNPIVGVDAEASPESGTIEADTTIDTSGELEERQMLDADLTGETTGSVGAEVGSATDITAADLVEESDITTELITDTMEQLSSSGTGLPAGEAGTEESSGTSSDPIVDLDTNISLESGTVDASVDLDMSGELEDRQILEFDLVAEEVGTTMADIDSVSDITGSETIESADITTEPVESLIPAPADLVAEIDTTGQTVGGEVDTGIVADVEGMSAGEDVVSDPADGLGL